MADTLAPGVKVRETAERETPAMRATSSAIAQLFSLSVIEAVLAESEAADGILPAGAMTQQLKDRLCRICDSA
ncbi:hypothetical protein [Pandoraea bronchicola]|uniref:hypothetical protein n=1 Tax=Pandoraea bronchicola TaxID=2508287 RepID=UPI001FE7D6D3|nr:hypothetical protein [Pandoraea bronchicola]